MAKRASALQKRSASRKRVVRPRRGFPPIRERMPEVFELPFVKPVAGKSVDEHLTVNDIDYWAPEMGGVYLDEEFRGNVYALLTAHFIARHECGSSALLRIFDAIAAKGGVWPSKRDQTKDACDPGSPSRVAGGFISGISDILRHAAANGIVRGVAIANGGHLAAVLAEHPPRFKEHRASVERAVGAFRNFAFGREATSTEAPHNG